MSDSGEKNSGVTADDSGSNALSTSTDLEDYMTGVTLKVQTDNQWADAAADSGVTIGGTTVTIAADKETSDISVTETAGSNSLSVTGTSAANTSQLIKSGSASVSPNSDGTYDATYVLLVNAGAEDMNADRDEVKLTDKLELDSGAAATLDYSSVKLYYYSSDYETGGDLSTLTEVNSSLWSYSYDSSTNTLTFCIPDNMAFILAYTYKVDIGGLNEVRISNTVSAESDIQAKENITINSGGSTVTKQGKLVICTLDSTNGKTLANAEFTLYAYNTGTKKWDDTSVILKNRFQRTAADCCV